MRPSLPFVLAALVGCANPTPTTQVDARGGDWGQIQEQADRNCRFVGYESGQFTGFANSRSFASMERGDAPIDLSNAAFVCRRSR